VEPEDVRAGDRLRTNKSLPFRGLPEEGTEVEAQGAAGPSVIGSSTVEKNAVTVRTDGGDYKVVETKDVDPA
jgi:hypothetical protein